MNSKTRTNLRTFPLRLWLALTTLVGLLACGATVRADIKVTFDLKDGDKISDITKVVAHVESSSDVDKVEFAVDDMLKKTSTSVPYAYDWDTLADTEGPHTISATATDTNGQSKSAKISLTVDNELNLGAAALSQKAQEARTKGDTTTALRYARRALKADAASSDAARVVAAIYAQEGELDKAVDTLANTKLDSDAAGMLELAGYRLERALRVENAPNFAAEYATVAELRAKAGALNVKTARAKAGDAPADPAALATYHSTIGDALLNAGRYHDATLEYGRSANGDNAPVTLVTRLALAELQDSRPDDALSLLRPIMRGPNADAATRAVQGLLLLNQRQFAEAKQMVANDAMGHSPAALIVAAFADYVLGQDRSDNSAAAKRRTALAEAREAVKLVPNAGEAHYALACITPDTNESRSEIAKALALSPFQSGPVLDYAARITLIKRQNQYDQPLALVNQVLKDQPGNVNAQIMQAMLLIQTDKLGDAQAILRDLIKAQPDAPDVNLAVAIYADKKRDPTSTARYRTQARKLDTARFDLNELPTPLEYIQLVARRLHYRPDAFLTPAVLDFKPAAVADPNAAPADKATAPEKP